MELFLNSTSPYARMVRIIVLEKGQAGAVTLRWCDPWADDADLLVANPAGRIPALVTDDGITLSESLLIATYLDGLGQGESILPPSWLGEVLHQAGLGQNLMDAAFTTVISRKHHGSDSDESVLGKRRWLAMHRLLDRLEAEHQQAQASTLVTLGDISIAVALAYLTFRLPEIAWKDRCPALAAWHASLSARNSFRSTVF